MGPFIEKTNSEGEEVTMPINEIAPFHYVWSLTVQLNSLFFKRNGCGMEALPHRLRAPRIASTQIFIFLGYNIATLAF